MNANKYMELVSKFHTRIDNKYHCIDRRFYDDYIQSDTRHITRTYVCEFTRKGFDNQVTKFTEIFYKMPNLGNWEIGDDTTVELKTISKNGELVYLSDENEIINFFESIEQVQTDLFNNYTTLLGFEKILTNIMSVRRSGDGYSVRFKFYDREIDSNSNSDNISLIDKINSKIQIVANGKLSTNDSELLLTQWLLSDKVELEYKGKIYITETEIKNCLETIIYNW